MLAVSYWLLATHSSLAQSNQRSKTVILNNDTMHLDTLSIIPGTISVKKQNGKLLDTASYKIDYVNALLIHSLPLRVGDTIHVVYKVFPFMFSQKYQHKDLRKIQNNEYGEPYVYNVDKNKN